MSDNAPKTGEFCWNEVATDDPAKAGRFYTELLGWTAEDAGMEGMPYIVFKRGETMVGGMFKMPPEMEGIPAHWLAYITVDDVDALAKKTVELGGEVHKEPTDVPNMGRFCVVSDPTGATVALMQFARE